MEETKTLSQFWRVKKSEVKVIELKESLQSLKRLLQHQLPEEFDVDFGKEGEDQSYSLHRRHDATNHHKLVVSPYPILKCGVFPAPAEIFDVECGLALHEANHILADSDNTRRSMYDAGKQAVYDQINTCGEEFVADNYLGNSAKQTQYIRNARKYYLQKLKDEGKMDAKSGDPVLDGLQAYMQMIVYSNPMCEVSSEGQPVLLKILEHFGKLDLKDSSQRGEIYELCTEEVYDIVKNQAIQQDLAKGRKARIQPDPNTPAVDPNSSMTYRQRRIHERKITAKVKTKMDKVEKELEEESGEELDKLYPEELRKEVQKAIEKQLEDITEELADLLGEVRGTPPDATPEQMKQINMKTVGTTTCESSMQEGFVDTDPTLLKDLAWLNNLKTDRSRVMKRNLTAGKIDSRRLSRLALNSCEVFRQSKIVEKNETKIWLLLDGSGSMRNHLDFYSACASFQQIIKNGRVYIYRTTSKNLPEILRIDAKEKIRNEHPDGNTPSGNALVYVVSLMHREEKSGIIIHLSDGDTNAGMTSQDAEKILEKYPKIKVMHLLYRTGEWKNSKQVQDIGDFSNELKKVVSEVYGIRM